MFDTAMLVLLYNKEINQSSTISSIVDSSARYTNTKIVIWNNGPEPLKERNTSSLSALGYKVEIMETLNNESLAVIYNRFIDVVKADKYILLDDDSKLNDDYINASRSNGKNNVAMPLISSNGVIEAPFINYVPYRLTLEIAPTDKIITIGSGLVIGSQIAAQIKDKHGDIFDERFYLYGVDSTFCLRLFALKLTDKIRLIDGFDHSLSRLEREDKGITEFRLKERSYDTGLTLRYYYPPLKAVYSLFRITITNFKKTLLKEAPCDNLVYLYKSFFSGKHYRDKF
ncbi:hypothetical protein Q4540_04725 [Pseudoalteromonas carrageenovora]|uniref:hypothetical protein n=1 Tax=Pseudoalteromonas carrageenovora TaxID=227 RepID=UPI0026E35CC9|nr:hypothetical protein [Pseudoalteromonas carrageenovora]MDO6635796.1 hypothetical protein [Pseudoalteromonas carrageenovora]MDO6647789.1 hypothetical protein [Pseudoalteromonas carrageenovora]